MASALNRLGLVYGRLELFDEALAIAGKAVRIEPKNPAHPTTLGLLYLTLDSPARAADAFSQAIVLDPEYLEAYEGLAEARTRLGDFDGAVSAMDRALASPILDRQSKAALPAKRDEIRARGTETAALRKRLEAGDESPEVFARLAALGSPPAATRRPFPTRSGSWRPGKRPKHCGALLSSI